MVNPTPNKIRLFTKKTPAFLVYFTTFNIRAYISYHCRCRYVWVFRSVCMWMLVATVFVVLLVMTWHVEFGVLMATCGFSVTVSIVVNNCSAKILPKLQTKLKTYVQAHIKSPLLNCIESALERFESTTINGFQ